MLILQKPPRTPDLRRTRRLNKSTLKTSSPGNLVDLTWGTTAIPPGVYFREPLSFNESPCSQTGRNHHEFGIRNPGINCRESNAAAAVCASSAKHGGEA